MEIAINGGGGSTWRAPGVSAPWIEDAAIVHVRQQPEGHPGEAADPKMRDPGFLLCFRLQQQDEDVRQQAAVSPQLSPVTIKAHN